MITKDQAITLNKFHTNECAQYIGPRGGKQITRYVFRRNGKTKVWKTRPNDFYVSLKYGLCNYYYLDQDNANQFHAPEDCPLNHS